MSALAIAAGRHALLAGSYLALSELSGIEYAHRRSRFKLDFGPTKQALASDYRFGKPPPPELAPRGFSTLARPALVPIRVQSVEPKSLKGPRE